MFVPFPNGPFQLRTRDCRDCTFYLFSLTEPVIELSSDIRFAPFNGGYSEVRSTAPSLTAVYRH